MFGCHGCSTYQTIGKITEIKCDDKDLVYIKINSTDDYSIKSSVKSGEKGRLNIWISESNNIQKVDSSLECSYIEVNDKLRNFIGKLFDLKTVAKFTIDIVDNKNNKEIIKLTAIELLDDNQ